jgi:hypothetical protein
MRALSSFHLGFEAPHRGTKRTSFLFYA